MIWLTGCRGMLGQDISLELEKGGILYIGTDADIDITSNDAVNNFIQGKNFKWIVNCAAYTAVDQAEDDRDNAFRLNAYALSNLVDAAEKTGAKIMHFSTDYVFDGSNPLPYREDDATGPTGVYGASKLEGERILTATFSRSFIFRISWLYGHGGKNFVHTMLNFFNSKEILTVVNDQYGSPTYTAELASFIAGLIKNDSDKFGIYHFSGEGETTWCEFSREIYLLAKRFGIVSRDVVIKPVDSSSYPTKAKRPSHSYMSKEKLAGTFGYSPKEWRISLEAYIKGMTVKS